MGGGRDKRKKAKPKTPGQGVEKTARKTERNEQRRDSRASKKAAVRSGRFCTLANTNEGPSFLKLAYMHACRVGRMTWTRCCSSSTLRTRSALK